MKSTKIIYLSRKLIAAAACAAAAAIMFWVVNNPAVVGASATTRQLPIYCVQKDYKVLSLSFDAAWGDAVLRTLGRSDFGTKKGPAELIQPGPCVKFTLRCFGRTV